MRGILILHRRESRQSKTEKARRIARSRSRARLRLFAAGTIPRYGDIKFRWIADGVETTRSLGLKSTSRVV